MRQVANSCGTRRLPSIDKGPCIAAEFRHVLTTHCCVVKTAGVDSPLSGPPYLYEKAFCV